MFSISFKSQHLSIIHTHKVVVADLLCFLWISSVHTNLQLHSSPKIFPSICRGEPLFWVSGIGFFFLCFYMWYEIVNWKQLIPMLHVVLSNVIHLNFWQFWLFFKGKIIGVLLDNKIHVKLYLGSQKVSNFSCYVHLFHLFLQYSSYLTLAFWYFGFCLDFCKWTAVSQLSDSFQWCACFRHR